MTIKSTVSKTPCEKKELPFPKLIQEIKWPGNIALAVSSSTAFQVAGSSLGFYYSRINPRSWQDYEGSVCLENDKDCC